MEFELLPAELCDAQRCYEILDSGRRFQREQGFVQWPDNYPLLSDVEDDIKNGGAYKLVFGDQIAGYMYIGFDGEPTYGYIEGEWSADVPYAVVHRIAFAPEFRGRGVGDKVFPLVEQLCKKRGIHCIRVDTDFPNLRMQHLVERCGFTRRGIIYVRDKEARIAYDKMW